MEKNESKSHRNPLIFVSYLDNNVLIFHEQSEKVDNYDESSLKFHKMSKFLFQLNR